MPLKGIITLTNTTTISGTVYPNLPNNWSEYHEDDSWFSIINDDNNENYFHARLMLDGNDPSINVPNKGVFVICGEKPKIKDLYDWLAARGVDIWTLHSLKNDNSVKATKIKTAWLTLKEMSGSSAISLKSTICGCDYGASLDDTITFDDLA